MTRILIAPVLALGAVTGLSGCLLSGGGLSAAEQYITLNSASGTGSLASVGTPTNGKRALVNQGLELNQIDRGEGTLDTSTGALDATLTSGIVIDDVDGGDESGDAVVYYSSGYTSPPENGDVLRVETIDGYDYVGRYTALRFDEGRVVLASEGYVGVVTAADDIPTEGRATYTGEGSLVAYSGDFGGAAAGAEGAGRVYRTQDYEATSRVVANFGAGTVNATVTSATAGAGQIDEVRATGMVISGNTFEGGTLSTRADGVNVDLSLGATASGGTFFGYDADDRIPDEVAGVITGSGLNSSLTAGFVAD